MSLSIRMSAVNKPHIDKVIKSNKRLKSAFHTRKLTGTPIVSPSTNWIRSWNS